MEVPLDLEPRTSFFSYSRKPCTEMIIMLILMIIMIIPTNMVVFILMIILMIPMIMLDL